MDRDKLEGHMLATQAAIRALIMIQPHPNAAALAVQREIERVVSSALPRNLPDSFVEGLQDAKKTLLPPARGG